MEKKIEDRNKLKSVVESIDNKLTSEGYVFTPRHFDVTMDALSQFNLVSKEKNLLEEKIDLETAKKFKGYFTMECPTKFEQWAANYWDEMIKKLTR